MDEAARPERVVARLNEYHAAEMFSQLKNGTHSLMRTGSRLNSMFLSQYLSRIALTKLVNGL